MPIAVVAVVLAGVWYGQAPPRSEVAYQKRAADAAGFLHSQLETVRLWVDEHPARVLDTSLVVAVEESESDAEATLSRFSGYDPPHGQEELRSKLTSLGEQATTLLGEMRIAAHREDWTRLADLSRRAESPSTKLEELSTRVMPR